MPRFCDVEPHAPECGVKNWLIRRALDRAAERQHGKVQVAGLRVREADGDPPLQATIERREHLQLLDFLRMPVQRT